MAALLLLAAGPLSAAAQAISRDADTLTDAVVARVNGSPILLSELKEAAFDENIPLSALTAEGLRGDGFRRVITLLVDNRLLVQEANLAEMTVDEEETAREVDQQMQRLVDQFGGEEQFHRFLKKMNLTMESLRTLLTERENHRSLAAKVVAQRVSITGDEIEAFAQQREAEGKPTESVQLAQILIRSPAAERENPLHADRFKRAVQIAREAEAQKDSFLELAVQYSDDPAVSRRGGYLGWIEPQKLREPLRKRLDAMRPGEVSEPIETEEGYHILHLMNRRDAHDLLYAEKFREERAKLLDRLREKATIEIYPLSEEY